MSGLKDFNVKHISEVGVKGDQEIVTMTKEEWKARAIELFGPDNMDWKFVCPACGNVASVGDFYPFRDAGAKPNSATCECIGRYDGHMKVPAGEGQPCNYTGYGLIDLCPVRVIVGDSVEKSFAFAEVPE